MKTLSNIPPPVLAVLAVGAVWWLSQRRASAAPLASAGNPYFGTDAATAAGRASMVSPSGVVPAVPFNPLQSILGLAQGLLGRSSAPRPVQVADRPPAAEDYRFGGPSVGVYGAPLADGQVVRAADYVPSWTPDSTGEAVAREYYLAHQEEFAAQPSPIFWQASIEDVPNTGGFLDSQ